MLCSCAAARPARPHHQPRQQHRPPHRSATASMRHCSCEALLLRHRHATSGPTSTAPATTPTSVKKKHAYIAPRELTQIMVADLAPHGMLLGLGGARAARGTGVVPRRVCSWPSSRRLLRIRLYLAAQLAEAGRRGATPGRRTGSLGSSGAGQNYPYQRPWTPWSRCYVAGVAWRCGLCCGPVLRFGEAPGTGHVSEKWCSAC